MTDKQFTETEIDQYEFSDGFVHDDLADHPSVSDEIKRGYDIGSLTRGLVTYYPMDEGQGQIVRDGALDAVGQINGASWTGSGQVGSDSLSFDGSNDYVDFANRDISGGATIAFWFKLTNTFDSNSTDIEAMTGKFEVTNEHVEVVLKGSEYTGDNSGSPTGSLLFKLENNVNGNAEILYLPSSETSWTGGVWYHVVASINPTDVTLYIDGSESASGTFNESNPLDVIEATWQIGRALIEETNLSNNSSNQYRYFNGDIDDFRLYDRPLSAIEVEALYNRTSPHGKLVTESDIQSQNDSGVSRYEFENDVTDSWGTNDGTDNTSAGFVDGIYGQAKDFDGTDDSVDFSGTSIEFSSTDNFTISFWFNGTSTQGFMYGSSSDSDYSSEYIYSENASNVSLNIEGDGNSTDLSIGNLDMGDGEWHHYVGVHDGSNSSAYLYIDGELVDSDTSIGTAGTYNIGGEWSMATLRNRKDSSDYTSVSLDDFRIYSQALSAIQVEELFNKGAYRINREDVL